MSRVRRLERQHKTIKDYNARHSQPVPTPFFLKLSTVERLDKLLAETQALYSRQLALWDELDVTHDNEKIKAINSELERIKEEIEAKQTAAKEPQAQVDAYLKSKQEQSTPRATPRESKQLQPRRS